MLQPPPVRKSQEAGRPYFGPRVWREVAQGQLGVPVRDVARCQRGEAAFRAESSIADLGVDASEQERQLVAELLFHLLDLSLGERGERLVRETAAGITCGSGAPREVVQPFQECVVVCSGAAGGIGHGAEL
ncbi:hypothetical protein [Kitasatospora sp. NPDC051914]|uniref:hypothetical protein n=1 Tax=Kitasatospora sp. NPDC051914 TaxID=3154945 RepID=UPI0034384D36